jgi:hypothetical protein
MSHALEARSDLGSRAPHTAPLGPRVRTVTPQVRHPQLPGVCPFGSARMRHSDAGPAQLESRHSIALDTTPQRVLRVRVPGNGVTGDDPWIKPRVRRRSDAAHAAISDGTPTSD